MKDARENERSEETATSDERIELLIEMLDIGSILRTDPHRMFGTADFAIVAIEALKRKFPESSSFYANAEVMRVQSATTAKNEFVDPFLVAARIGYAYAFAIVREWQSMVGRCERETFSEGPADGSCSGCPDGCGAKIKDHCWNESEWADDGAHPS